MKCPGCKNEVARLIQRNNRTDWPEGLCVTCDAVDCAEEGEALNLARQIHGRPAIDPDVPAPVAAKRSVRRMPMRDEPRVKRKYVRRAREIVSGDTNGAPEKPVKSTSVGAGAARFDELLAQYQEEYDRAEHALAVAKVKLDTLAEVRAFCVR